MLYGQQTAEPTVCDALVVDVAGVHLGVPGSDVRELLRAVATLPVPHAPAGIEGVIDLRGTIVPIHDLRWYLYLPPRALRPSDHFVIVDSESGLAGLRVDRAVDLVQVECSITGGSDRANDESAVPGVFRGSGGLLIVRELRELLATDRTAIRRRSNDARSSGESGP